MYTHSARPALPTPSQVGTPCWNSLTPGADFRGLASANPNVSLCWEGGSAATGHGGAFLNNHNWVEVHDGTGAAPYTRSAHCFGPLPSPFYCSVICARPSAGHVWAPRARTQVRPPTSLFRPAAIPLSSLSWHPLYRHRLCS
jgi:hypothetical protein